jgi:hypothetical protein
MTCVAPSDLAKSSLLVEEDVAMTVAPRADAIYSYQYQVPLCSLRDHVRLTCMAKQLTPPVPMVNTVLPCNRFSVHAPFHSSSTPSTLKSNPPRIALQAVVPAVTRLAASVALRLVGASTTHSSSTTMYCCNVPSLLMPPKIVSAERLRMSPSIQLLQCRMTFVPVLLDHVDEGPVEWMMPAPSEPGIKPDLWSPGSGKSVLDV